MSARYSSITPTTFSHSYLYQEVGCCVLTLPCVLSEISSTLHLLKVRMADFIWWMKIVLDVPFGLSCYTF